MGEQKAKEKDLKLLQLTRSELEGLTRDELEKLVLTLSGSTPVFPKGVFKFGTHEDLERWEKNIFVEYYLSQQSHDRRRGNERR